MYSYNDVETTKEFIREKLAEEFNKQNAFQVWCNVKDDFENCERGPIFYIVMYDMDDYFSVKEVRKCMENDEIEAYGIFRISSMSLIGNEDLSDYGLIWEEGEWKNAS